MGIEIVLGVVRLRFFVFLVGGFCLWGNILYLCGLKWGGCYGDYLFNEFKF